jgi:hypothetical protein
MAYKPTLLTLAESGTGANLTASNGGIFYSNASTAAVLAGTATAGQILRSGASTTPGWSTATYPATAGTSGNVLTSDGTNWASSPAAAGGGMAFNFRVGAGSPADGQTYYQSFGTSNTLTGFTASSQASTRVVLPINCTLKACSGNMTITGTLGSSENVTIAIRKNDTSNTNVTTTYQMTANPSSFSNVALSAAFSAGDYFDLIMICPTWVTNPTTVTPDITVYFTVP